MHPKAEFSTPSLRSNTSKTKSKLPALGLDTPVQFLKGVGPRIAHIFAKRDIHTVRDLLFFRKNAERIDHN